MDTQQQAQERDPSSTLYDFRVENSNTLACEEDGCSIVGSASESTFVDEGALWAALDSESHRVEEYRRPQDQISTDLSEWAEETTDPILTLSISLEDTDTWSIPAGLEDDERAIHIQDRKAAVKGAQDLAESFVLARNGRVLHRFWLVNHLLIEIPIDRALELLNLPGVIDIQRDEPGPPPVFDGRDLKDGVRTNEYYQMGYWGNHGGPGGWDYGRIGILEAHVQDYDEYYNGLHCNHCGFSEPGGCYAQRVRTASKCLSNGFCGNEYDKSACVTDQSDRHGAWVTWAAAGSIEWQQDPNFPGQSTLDQRKRGGIQQGGYIYYYQADTVCRRKQALERLVEQGAQVVNMSFAGLECSATYDSCSFNALSSAYHNTHTTLVAGAGNAGGQGSGLCHTGWPARRPEVISVGMLGASGSNSYRNTKRHSDSSNGTFSGSYLGGGTASVNLVDILAPGHFTKMFAGQTGYLTNYEAGTSLAAPVVAAIANLTRDWMYDIGWTLTAGTIPALMLLYGDGYTGSLSTSGSYYSFTMSPSSGAGRIRAAMINQLSSGSPRYWSTRTKTMYQGETYDWPIVSGPASSLYTGAKVAMFGIDSDFQNIPRIRLQIVDKCPAGGGTTVISTASESAGALRKKIRLTSPSTQIHGRCLYARMVGLNIPSGGWKVWAATMAYSNTPELH